MKTTALPLLACLVALSAPAQEILFAPGEKMGINPIPADRNLWQSRQMVPCDYSRKNVVPCEEADFFTLEYGAPLAPFALDVTPKGASRLWGERFDDHSGQAVRFGRGWYPYVHDHVQIRGEIEQKGEGAVAWSLLLHNRSGKTCIKSFTTKAGANPLALELEMVRLQNLYRDGGLELVAKGPDGIRATVKSFRIFPVRAPVAFRRTLVLDAAPWRAGLSFTALQSTKILVNGRTVYTAGAQMPRGVERIDLTKDLKAGTNEIVLTRNGDVGWERNAVTDIEAFTVLRDGTTRVYPGGDGWEARTGEGEWKPVQTLGPCGLTTLQSGLKSATGFQPMHAGPLDPKPAGSLWPVFDADGDVAYSFVLPPEMKDAKVTVTATDSFTGEKIETAESAGGCLAFKTRRPGAYRLDWTLADASGKAVDTLRGEMLIIGKLPLDEFSAEGVERALRDRLSLLQEIDCTAEAPADRFLDHSGYYGKQTMNVGRVLERDGFRVRETGNGRLDLLSWKIACGTPGQPHVCEVDLPDTREQYAYCSVTETFPVPFCNNSPPPGARSWPNASGAAFSGGLMPLSGKMKTLRFVFFPSSQNITFNVENGRYGLPVGISRVRIYEVKGSLPALKVPATERLFANHCERPIFFNWGNAAVPYMLEYDHSYREGMWAGAYRAIVNRVQQLKFMGHNAAIEAGFMYYFGFKTKSGLSVDIDEDFDPCVPLLMMYAKNGIRSYLSYEFTGSPALMTGACRDTSDRDVAAGRPTISFMDRYGRQSLAGGYGGQSNFLDPRVRGAMAALLKEMYARYAPLGAEGVILETEGCAWQPMFGGATYTQSADEVGYDDRTVALFERDAGVKLRASAQDPKRFSARYDELHADAALLAKWNRWKAAQIAATHRALASVVKTGTNWRYIVSPCEHEGLPIGSVYTREWYPKDGSVEILHKAPYNREPEIDTYSRMTSDEFYEKYREFDGLYLAPVGLNEHNFSRLGAAKKWWWRSYGVIVYDMFPIGDNAFYDCATVCRDRTPKTFVHTWLDVNVPTGHDAASRRFLEGFYATPVGDGVPYPQASGVTAHVYGGKLQLLNLTPYPLVSDAGIAMKPYDLKVVGAPRPMAFRFADGAKDAVARVERILADPLVRDALSAPARAQLDAAKTSYDRLALSYRGDILNVVLHFEAAKGCFANQKRFEAALAKEGCARINCGSAVDTTDEKGVKWLPDQKDTGFRAYGCAHGGWTSRGEIPIADTDRPSVYRTESSTGGNGKHMVYAFPVPEGTYRVVVHIADTYNKEDRGHKWSFGIGDDWRRVNIWTLTGGKGAAATVHAFENVKPVDGVIRVDFESAVVNGIEIYRR